MTEKNSMKFVYHFFSSIPQIRSAGIIWYSFCNNATSFIIDKFFPILVEIIYLQGVLLVLSFTCGIGLVFVFFMAETKGQPLDTTTSLLKLTNKNLIQTIQKQNVLNKTILDVNIVNISISSVCELVYSFFFSFLCIFKTTNQIKFPC